MTDPSRPGPPEAGSRSPQPPGWRRRYTALGSGVLLAGAVGYVGLVDPHNRNSLFPLCPFRLLTGWNCPFCGGLRMLHDLLHGDLVAAVADNVFVLVGIPVLVGWVLMRRHRGQPLLPIPAVVTIAVAAIAWTVLRNLPGFPLVPAIYPHDALLRVV